jgi:hypothetical protein
MDCTNSVCTCGTYNYYNNVTRTCNNQTLINATCTSTAHCRSDKGLSCVNGMCQCSTTGYKWSIERSSCILAKTYTEQTCNYDSDCNVENGLVCNTGQSCNCPTISTTGMCDCYRNTTKEYYWNGTSCQQAVAYEVSCSSISSSYVCRTLTEGTICNGSSGILTCQCPTYMYFNTTSSTCKNQTTYNTYCSSSISCRSDLNLLCQSNICVCNSTTQFWSSILGVCTNLYKYTESGCTSDSECASTLICNNSTNTKCTCPTSLTANTCDCPRSYGYEYYWNGLACVIALSNGVSCSNTSTTYMCNWITEGTVCNITTSGTYTCQCPIYTFYNSTACRDQTLYNTVCSLATSSCRTDLGLSCQWNLCLCNSTAQFWSTSLQTCMSYYTYTSSGCTADSQCASTLICNNSTNTKCSCPTALTANTCDCPRSYGYEYYWNGVSCVYAVAYNQSCTADYMCQTLTQNTNCDSVTKKCLCGPSGGLSSITNKCTYCSSGYTFYESRCYYYSTLTYPSTLLYFNTTDIHTACGNNSLATYAKIDSLFILNMIRAIVPAGLYWVGANSGFDRTNCPGGSIPAENFVSDDGLWNLNATVITWCTGFPISKITSDCCNCAAYDSVNNCLQNDVCTYLHPVICTTA